METTITLNNIETKLIKSGPKAGSPMWTADTNEGKMSVFDKPTADILFTLIKKNIKVDVETKGNYKNITRIIGIAEFAPQEQNIPQAQTQAPKEIDIKLRQRLSSGTMCIAYAKDLVVAGKLDIKDMNAKAKELLSLYEEMLDIKFV